MCQRLWREALNVQHGSSVRQRRSTHINVLSAAVLGSPLAAELAGSRLRIWEFVHATSSRTTSWSDRVKSDACLRTQFPLAHSLSMKSRCTSTYSWLPLLTSVDSNGSLLEMLTPESEMQKIHSSEETIIYRAELNRAASAVVLKVAINAGAVQRLKNEHEMYRKLQAMQGTQIPRCHGLFVRSGREEGVISKRRWAGACLLLDYCGEPLVAMLPDMPWNFRFAMAQ